MALASTFTPTAYGSMQASDTSSNAGLPGATGDLLITNLGPCDAVVALGTSNTATVSESTGVAILAHQSLALVIGSNTRIAAICAGGGTLAVLNLAVGS